MFEISPIAVAAIMLAAGALSYLVEGFRHSWQQPQRAHSEAEFDLVDEADYLESGEVIQLSYDSKADFASMEGWATAYLHLMRYRHVAKLSDSRPWRLHHNVYCCRRPVAQHWLGRQLRVAARAQKPQEVTA